MNAYILNIKNNTTDIVDCNDYDTFTQYCEEHQDLAYSLQMLEMSMSTIPEIPQAFAVTEDIVAFTENAISNKFIKYHELGHIKCGHIAAALTQVGTDVVAINDAWELEADAYAVQHTSRELALDTLTRIRDQVKNHKQLPQELKDTTIKQLDLRIQAL